MLVKKNRYTSKLIFRNSQTTILTIYLKYFDSIEIHSEVDSMSRLLNPPLTYLSPDVRSTINIKNLSPKQLGDIISIFRSIIDNSALHNRQLERINLEIIQRWREVRAYSLSPSNLNDLWNIIPLSESRKTNIELNAEHIEFVVCY